MQLKIQNFKAAQHWLRLLLCILFQLFNKPGVFNPEII